MAQVSPADLKSLPNLPGYTFPEYKDNYPRQNSWNLVNGVRIEQKDGVSHDKPKFVKVSKVQDVWRSGSLPDSQTRAVFKNAGADIQFQELPAWDAFDRHVLRFTGYFKESVVETNLENFRVRKVVIYYYLEDDTCQIQEPKQDNSGMPQGQLIRRHRFPAADGGYLKSEDIRVGSTLQIYGRSIFVTDCDPFTREYCEQLGMPQGPPEPEELDPFQETRNAMKNHAPVQPRTYEKIYREVMLGGGHINADMQQFLEKDKKVLRFYAVLDDVTTPQFERRPFTLMFFLADDTIEIREQLAFHTWLQQVEVAELREEVDSLKLEVGRLRRELAGLRVRTTSESYSRSESEGSFSVISQGIAAGASSARPALPPAAPTAAPSSPSPSLTWEERDRIADGIGRYLARCVAGDNRGTSGRDQVSLGSKLWIVVRDYAGQIYTPVRVSRSWGSVKALVKPSGPDPGDSIFVGVPSEREARRAVILITEFEGKRLVAFPAQVWNRKPERRVLPHQCLSRPTVVEVQAVRPEALDEPLDEVYIKLWIGYLKEEYYDQVVTHLEELECDYAFGVTAPEILLPSADALIAVAQEHFAFFSAEEEPQEAEAEEQEERDVEAEEPARRVRSGRAPGGSGSGALSKRVEAIEAAVGKISEAVMKLTAPSTPQSSAHSSPAILSPKTKASTKRPSALRNRNQYPLLDGGVVEAALQAGIGHESLEEMQKLLSRNTKASKVKDINRVHFSNPLSEDEEEAELEGEGAVGSPAHPDSMNASLTKLTAIVEMLSEERKKKAGASRIDQALDGASHTGETTTLGSGKKNAAARRALRATFNQEPLEIANLIEKLMWEDLNSQTLGPGQMAHILNARSWVEFRSKIGNFKTSAHCAWSAAGILDAIISGDIPRARARSALLLLMLDQCSVDHGSWVLASELSLEGPPPFASLATHKLPSVSDGELPYSKLLDAQWAEISLSHLRDQEEYLTRRKSVGKFVTSGAARSSAEDPAVAEQEPKRRPKLRPKAKATQSPQSGAAPE
eukprot:s418_g21.t1